MEVEVAPKDKRAVALTLPGVNSPGNGVSKGVLLGAFKKKFKFFI